MKAAGSPHISGPNSSAAIPLGSVLVTSVGFWVSILMMFLLGGRGKVILVCRACLGFNRIKTASYPSFGEPVKVVEEEVRVP